MIRKLVTAAAVVLGFLLLSYSVAAAWSAEASGSYACSEGQRQITWTIDASEESVDGLATWTLSRTSDSPSTVITGGSHTVPASGAPISFGTIVPSTGTYTLYVVTTWHSEEQLLDTAYSTASVEVSNECVPPATTTRPPVTTLPPKPCVPYPGNGDESRTICPITTTTTPTPPPTTTAPPVVTSAPPVPVPTELAYTGLSTLAKVLALVASTAIILGVLLLAVGLSFQRKEDGKA